MDTRSSGSIPWWVSDDEELTPDERQLLHRVEVRFVEDAGGLAEWADPHHDPSIPGHRQDPEDDEYSRCLDPEKYNIVLARTESWTTVLTSLEWANATTTTGGIDDSADRIDWALPPWSDKARGTLTVLRPTAELNKEGLSIQSGTGAQTGGPNTRMKHTASFEARPWSASWTPRPVRTRIDPPRRVRSLRLPKLARKFAPLRSKAKLRRMQGD